MQILTVRIPPSPSLYTPCQILLNHFENRKMILGLQGAYNMDEESWGGISEEAKELTRRLLSVDPFARPSAVEVLLQAVR